MAGMRPRTILLGLLVMVLALVAACTGTGEGRLPASPGADTTAAPTPPVSGAMASPSAERTAVPTNTSAPTPKPTLTETPTATATRTRTQTPEPAATEIPTLAPEPSPTPTLDPGPLAGARLVSALRGGGYVLYFRHAATDPTPDDARPVVLSDCTTQRNLSARGREQSVAIGEASRRLAIPIGDVLASPFCRTLDTARLAFGKAAAEPGIENLETVRDDAERQARVDVLKRLLNTSPGRGTNTVVVAHGNILSAAAGVTVVEGGAAIFLPREGAGPELVATVTPAQWAELPAP